MGQGDNETKGQGTCGNKRQYNNVTIQQSNNVTILQFQQNHLLIIISIFYYDFISKIYKHICNIIH